MAKVYLYQQGESVKKDGNVKEPSMKLLTVKYPSGLEVRLSAFLLRMASLDVGQVQRLSINRESFGVGVKDTEPPSLNNQKEGRHEH